LPGSAGHDLHRRLRRRFRRKNGWKIFGDTNLFQWDSTNHNLAVTWDSSQTNSYLLSFTSARSLAIDDAFSLEFDLNLAGAQTGAYGSQLAVGFLNIFQCHQPGVSAHAGARRECGRIRLFSAQPD